MTVKQGGRWYVSLEYTAAEYIRRAAGWEVPAVVSRTPVGFDTPDAAVTGFYERLATLDFQSVLDTFAPGYPKRLSWPTRIGIHLANFLSRPGERKWDVEAHGGVSLINSQNGGSSSLPTTGAIVGGLIGVSSFYLGDGARLFNQNQTAVAGGQSIPVGFRSHL